MALGATDEPNAAAAAADASDAMNQEPLGGEVAVLTSEPGQSSSAASHPDTSASAATEEMTQKDGTAEIASATQQEEPPPRILEEGPAPTVDELLVEYGSSLPPSPCSTPASPGSDPEAAAPGDEPPTTGIIIDGPEPPAEQQLPQLNGEEEGPMAGDSRGDNQNTCKSKSDGGAEAECPEEMERPAEQHMPNSHDSGTKSPIGSVVPLPQAQDEPPAAVESEDVDAAHDTGLEEKPKDDEVPAEFTLTFTDYVDMQLPPRPSRRSHRRGYWRKVRHLR